MYEQQGQQFGEFQDNVELQPQYRNSFDQQKPKYNVRETGFKKWFTVCSIWL